MEYLNTKRRFGPNECRPLDERDAIASDLNVMTIEDLGKDSDHYFVLDFLKQSAVVEHCGFTVDEVDRGLRALYKHITPNRNPWILESSLTRLKSNLEYHQIFDLVLNKVTESDGERIAGAALQTLIYLEIYRNKTT